MRVPAQRLDGAAGLLAEAWNRYGLPMAITEAHLGCSREEQVRWLEEIYTDAVRLRAQNVDVRAMTVWSVFGAWEWNSLLTRAEGHYESGCFDCRRMPVRPTLVASWVKSRAAGMPFEHPALDRSGWWRASSQRERARPIAICGDTVTAQHCAALCDLRGLATVMFSNNATVRDLSAELRDERAWLVIDADSGWNSKPARIARSAGLPLLVLSTATEASLTTAETAAIMASGAPLIVRYDGFRDSRTWLNRAFDLMLDGEIGVWNEAAGETATRVS